MGGYAKYFNARYRRSGHLWQGRFWKRWPFDKEHVDSELALTLDQITPKAAAAS